MAKYKVRALIDFADVKAVFAAAEKWRDKAKMQWEVMA